ncbi:MAG: MauE/DoxX family redox-associated membrane protein, partial [bacterium]
MQSSKIMTTVRFLLSVIFLLSGIGKLIDIPAAAFSLAQLFFLPKMVAQIAVVVLSVAEVGLAILIWLRAPKILLAVPAGFAFVLGYSYWKGFDCGCFGSLPFLKEFPLGAHILLILGIFAGIYYLAKAQKDTENNFSTKSGPAAVVMIVLAFLTLPFS